MPTVKVDPKIEYQKQLDDAFEEVIGDLESTRKTLKDKVEEIATATKEELLKPKKQAIISPQPGKVGGNGYIYV